MRIWALGQLDNTGRLDMDTADMKHLSRSMRGVGYRGPWSPVKVWSLVRRAGIRPKPILDITSSFAPIFNFAFSAKARAVLAPHLDPIGQWFELVHKDKPLFLFNLTNMVAALDEGRSTYRTRTNGERELRGYAFQPDIVAREWMFRLPQPDHLTPIFVTSRFVEVIEANKLEGFHFKPAWDSAIPTWPLRPSGSEILERKDVFGPGGFFHGFESDWPQAWKDEEKARKLHARAQKGRSKGEPSTP